MCQTVREEEAEELTKLVVEWPPLCTNRDMMMIMMRESWIILMKSARVCDDESLTERISFSPRETLACIKYREAKLNSNKTGHNEP